MRRALLVVWYAFQACLGLAMIGLAAAAPTSPHEEAHERSDKRADARAGDRSPTSTHSPGPSIP